MAKVIECGSATECWKKALKTIIDEGIDFGDDDERTCREVANIQIKVNGNAIDLDKPISMLNSFDEWKYPPLKELKNVMLAITPSPDYLYSYGPRIFNFQKKINQVNDFIIPLLQAKPSTRKAVISLWDPVEDANILNSDSPGLVTLDFKLRKGKLNVTGIIRSNDMFFGWPANIYQIRVIQEYIAKKIGCPLGDIITFSVSAHIFIDQMEHIKKILD